jgi:hypothetical protein
MDEFVLPIDNDKFRSTNGAWNNLKLNDPWSVGYTTTLVVVEDFSKKEDWEAFYYKSGEQRVLKLKNLSYEYQEILNNEQLVLKDEVKVKQLSLDLRNLNSEFGRTQEQLRKKGQLLYEVVKNNGFGLTLEECFQCVRFRVICQTWNGVIVREINTIRTLKQSLPLADFRKVAGDFDYMYAVDYEVYKNDRLVYGLQIKPESYTWHAAYISKARYANRQKNQLYTSKYGVPVYDIISNSGGVIKNQEILKNL